MSKKDQNVAFLSCFVLFVGLVFVIYTANAQIANVEKPKSPATLDDRRKLAAAGFKRLTDLQAALKRMPREKYGKEPHKTFIKKNEKDITYSEPSAEYYVRSERFWELREKYEDLPIADDIAWAAAKNPLPGECEGYLNCYLFLFRSTDAEYLRHYPNGKFSKAALRSITNGLGPTVSDLGKNESHSGPTDPSDKAELAKLIAEITAILSKVSHPDSVKAVEHLGKIGDAYK